MQKRPAKPTKATKPTKSAKPPPTPTPVHTSSRSEASEEESEEAEEEEEQEAYDNEGNIRIDAASTAQSILDREDRIIAPAAKKQQQKQKTRMHHAYNVDADSLPDTADAELIENEKRLEKQDRILQSKQYTVAWSATLDGIEFEADFTMHDVIGLRASRYQPLREKIENLAREHVQARGDALHTLTPEVTVTWANQKNGQKTIPKIRQNIDRKQNVLTRIRQCFLEKPEKRHGYTRHIPLQQLHAW